MSEKERQEQKKKKDIPLGTSYDPINWQSEDVQSPPTTNALKRSTWFYADGHDTIEREREREREGERVLIVHAEE